jgi:hypothetical protein
MSPICSRSTGRLVFGTLEGTFLTECTPISSDSKKLLLREILGTLVRITRLQHLPGRILFEKTGKLQWKRKQANSRLLKRCNQF